MSKLAGYFVKGERELANGSKVVIFADDRPEWLYDAVYESHDGSLPNDWIFETAEAACDAIDQGTLTNDDEVSEFADQTVDCYTAARFAWGADMCGTALYANAAESLDDAGGEPTNDVGEILGKIQYFAIESIARTILDAYKASQDDDDDDVDADCEVL